MDTKITVDPTLPRRDFLRSLIDTAAKEFAEQDRPFTLISGEVVSPFDPPLVDWAVTPGSAGRPEVRVDVRDGDYTAVHRFPADYLEDKDIRGLAISPIWGGILRHRSKLQLRKLREAVASMAEDE